MDQKLKKDAGKLRYDLFPQKLKKALTEVYHFGHVKKNYGKGSWKDVEDWRYEAAEGRHDERFTEDKFSVDDESGLLHAAHRAWNACTRLMLVINELEEQKNETPQAAKEYRCDGCSFNDRRNNPYCIDCDGVSGFEPKETSK